MLLEYLNPEHLFHKAEAEQIHLPACLSNRSGSGRAALTKALQDFFSERLEVFSFEDLTQEIPPPSQNGQGDPEGPFSQTQGTGRIGHPDSARLRGQITEDPVPWPDLIGQGFDMDRQNIRLDESEIGRRKTVGPFEVYAHHLSFRAHLLQAVLGP